MNEIYTVYDTRDNRFIASGTYQEIKDYLECDGRYFVIRDSDGKHILLDDIQN